LRLLAAHRDPESYVAGSTPLNVNAPPTTLMQAEYPEHFLCCCSAVLTRRERGR
jgi:hypothetical protein